MCQREVKLLEVISLASLSSCQKRVYTFSHHYPSLFKINISTDRGMAAVPTPLAGSAGFSEAQMCDNGTEAQEVTMKAQRFCSLRPFSHIPVLDSEQCFHPIAL